MFVRNLLAGVLAGSLLLGAPAVYAQSSEPAAAVKAVVERVLELLRDKSLDREDRRGQLRANIAPHFDFDAMSRSILAAAWKQATPAEQARFLTLFQKLLENTYITAMEDYADQTVRYGKDRVNGNLATVNTFIVRTSAVETPVQYRLRNRDGQWLAYDVAVEGVSLVNNYRTSFRSIVRKDGMAGLIDQLDRKLNKSN